MPTYQRKTIDLLISDELKNLLKEIESDSVVAKLLLKKRHSKEDLVESPVNYISISHDDKSKISYLTTDRINSLDPDTYWSSNSRYKGKPGAFVGKLFKNIPSKEVEKFSNLFRTQSLMPKFTFKIVEGDEIKKYYHYSSYIKDCWGNTMGSLGASCMKHDRCQKYFKIYTKNSDQVKLLIMLDENDMLIGRALLWDIESNKIMDRIYTKLDEDYMFHFKKWATQNGYLYKSQQNWNNTIFFENLNIKQKELYLEFNLGKTPKKYPYMDTFKFIDIKTGRLFNYIPDNVEVVTLISNHGGYENGDCLKFDGVDKIFRHSSETTWLSYLNIHTTRANCNYSELNDTYILSKDCQYNNEVNDYIFIGDYSHLNKEYKKVEEDNSVVGYYDYSRVIENLVPTRTSSIIEKVLIMKKSINTLRDLIVDLDTETDYASIGTSLYRQWQQLSRNEQEEVLVSVNEVVDNHQDEDLQLEEEPTPF